MTTTIDDHAYPLLTDDDIRDSAIAFSYISLAIAAVATIFWVLAPLGAIGSALTGFIALRRWRHVDQDRRQGKWAAITGVSLGAVLAAGSVAVGVFVAQVLAHPAL